jgi:hypothetical protein
MKKTDYIILLSLTFFLAGCTEAAQTLPTSLPTRTIATLLPTLTSASTATKTLSPTLTPTPIPPSETPTETLSPTPDSGVIQNCLAIQPNPPDRLTYSGKVALEDTIPGNADISLYDLSTGEMTRIADQGAGLSVSPDHTLYAYRDIAKNRLEVFSADGKQIKSLTWRAAWRLIERWLDNQRMAIVTSGKSPVTGYWLYPPDVLFLNPFTSQAQTLRSNYPDLDWSLGTVSFLPWFTYSVTIYSTDLKRVVYPGYVFLNSPDVGTGYILYGLPEEKKLAEIPNQWRNSPPLWSPDGSRFVMVGKDNEVYLVSYDGVISKVTHLNPDFDKDSNTRLLFDPWYYSWSPDNQHIAFWLRAAETDQYIFAVLDTLSGEINNYCISGGKRGEGRPSYPVWSPDGKMLVVAANANTEKKEYKMILVDFEKHIGFILASDQAPVGWLATP